MKNRIFFGIKPRISDPYNNCKTSQNYLDWTNKNCKFGKEASLNINAFEQKFSKSGGINEKSISNVAVSFSSSIRSR